MSSPQPPRRYAVTDPALVPPSRSQLLAYAARHGVELSGDGLDDELARVAALVGVVERLDELAEPAVTLRYPERHAGWVPGIADDPDNSIIRFCEVKGAATGPLKGKRIAVKDNIAVAGVPMTGGREPAFTTVPSEDAVVVERLLDAGATIVAKTNMVPSVYGETRNPLDGRFSPGMSSSGSAAAVARGIADAALGADQAGSVRWPAAWCGIVGMKATHGLVPSYGLLYSDHTIDHIGPMTRTVADNAAMLEIMAGGDWRDPQWVRADPRAGDYTTSLDRGINGLRIGVVTESLEASGCTAATLVAFDRARSAFTGLGAELVPVSVELWRDSYAIAVTTSIFTQPVMVDSFGQGFGHLGRVSGGQVASAVSHQLTDGAKELRTVRLARAHLHERYLGTHFARAQSLRLELRRQVDSLFDHVDLLITPTTPTGPFELPAPPPSDVVKLARKPLSPGDAAEFPGSPMLTCCPFNLTGHPALTVPSGPGDNNLPTGLQIVGPRFGEEIVYRAGFAFETATQEELT